MSSAARGVIGTLWNLLAHRDADPLRLFISVSSLLWGMLLLAPGATFERPVYAVMRGIAPETLWALAHLVHGLATLLSLATGRRGRLMFLLDPVFGSVLWTTSGIAMLVAVSPVPAAIAPHLVGAIASWWLLVRYARW